MAAVQVTTHKGAGVRHKCMVCRRGQSCNTTSSATVTKRTLPDQVRTWDAMRCCFGVQPRQVIDGDVQLDFGHFQRV
jgi:hypothetical protein